MKEQITGRQGLCMATMFLIGSSLVVGAHNEAQQDSWLGILTGMLFASPIIFIYARMKKLLPEMDLYDILQYAWGRVLGKIFVALFAWYALHLGALVIRNFTEFMSTQAFPETPQYIPALFMGLLTIYAIKSGQETLGRWSSIFLILVITVFTFTLLIGTEVYNIDHLKPIASNGIAPILDGGFSVFTFPFAESVILLLAFGAFKPGASPYKMFFGALAVGGGIILIGALRNLMILGPVVDLDEYYSSYEAVKVISLGTFFQRFEVIIGVNLLLCGFVKIALCLLAAGKGIAKLFGIQGYKKVSAPTGLLMMILSIFVYGSTMEMFGWLVTYKYYALPFQVILPVITWIAAEIKVRRQKKIISTPGQAEQPPQNPAESGPVY